jgi:hypothetical protein
MSLQDQSLALFYYVLLGFPVSRRRQLRLRSDARERNATSFVDKHDDELILYLIALQFGTTSNESFVHSRNRKVFYQMLSMSERRRRDRHIIPRVSLVDPPKSSWRKLYESENDQSMKTLTGFDFAAFHWLLNKFSPIYNQYTPHTKTGEIQKLTGSPKGRARLLNAADCHALNLAWTRLCGSFVALQMIFGISSTSVSIYLRFGRRIIIKVLQNDPNAAIRVPSADKIQEYQSAVAAKYPSLAGVWCTMDGLKLYLEQSTDHVIQSRFYNGWTHDHYVSAVLVFCPDGTIPIATYVPLAKVQHVPSRQSAIQRNKSVVQLPLYPTNCEVRSC